MVAAEVAVARRVSRRARRFGDGAVGIERLPAWTGRQRGHSAIRALGVVLAVRGLAGFALTGFDHLFVARGEPFLGLRLSPAVDVALVAVGYLLACWLPARRPRVG